MGWRTCGETVTLKGGEVVACDVAWNDEHGDQTLIHGAKLHQGSITAEDGRNVGLLWDQ